MDALGINGPFLVAQIINFLLLMVLLRMFLYGPMLNMLEQRREKIRESLSAAETARAEAATRGKENEEIIARARREGQDIVRQAEETARRRADAILNQAQTEANALRERQQGELEVERRQLMAQARAEIAQISLSIARKTIGASLVDERAHARIVDEALAEVGT